MPGIRGKIRAPATSSRGFSARRRKASKSLTWAVSTNFSPPYLWKGMLPGRQLGLQQHAVVRGPKQHGLPPQGDARLAMFEDLADHEVRLLDLVFARDLDRPLPSVALGPEVLRIALGGQADHAVGGLQDRLRAAVVLLQPDDLRARDNAWAGRECCGPWPRGRNRSIGRRRPRPSPPCPAAKAGKRSRPARHSCPGTRRPARNRTARERSARPVGSSSRPCQ